MREVAHCPSTLQRGRYQFQLSEPVKAVGGKHLGHLFLLGRLTQENLGKGQLDSGRDAASDPVIYALCAVAFEPQKLGNLRRSTEFGDKLFVEFNLFHAAILHLMCNDVHNKFCVSEKITL